jgi:flagellar hook-length control protein FliK
MTPILPTNLPKLPEPGAPLQAGSARRERTAPSNFRDEWQGARAAGREADRPSRTDARRGPDRRDRDQDRDHREDDLLDRSDEAAFGPRSDASVAEPRDSGSDRYDTAADRDAASDAGSDADRGANAGSRAEGDADARVRGAAEAASDAAVLPEAPLVASQAGTAATDDTARSAFVVAAGGMTGSTGRAAEPDALAARSGLEQPAVPANPASVPVAAAQSVEDADAARAQQQVSETRSAAATPADGSRVASGDDAFADSRSGAAHAAGEPGSKSASKSATKGATAPTSNDPLARLVEDARLVMQRTAATTGGTAVAARLGEVEGAIARDNISASAARGEVRLEPGAAEAATAQPANGVAGELVQQGAPRGAGTTTASLTTGQSLPGMATADTAALEGEPHPSAQLAARGAALLANQRGGAITMRLEPSALGQLRIDLRVTQGAVLADFTAASHEARLLLEANLGMLRERLESQGLAVERITVHAGRGTEAAAQSSPQNGHDARQEGADARSDRGERSGTRQDAAGGESRGRRDGEPRGDRGHTDVQRQGATRGFADTLSGETAQRTEPMRRAG